MTHENEFELLNAALEAAINATLGENRFFVAYGEGTYDGKKRSVLVDNLVKDMLMVALQPIANALIGAMMTGLGLLRMVGSLLTLDTKNLVLSIAMILTGAGITLLTVITPIARIFNLFCRALATDAKKLGLIEEKTERSFKPDNGKAKSAAELNKLVLQILNGDKTAFTNLVKEIATQVVAAVCKIQEDARITPLVNTVAPVVTAIHKGLFEGAKISSEGGSVLVNGGSEQSSSNNTI